MFFSFFFTFCYTQKNHKTLQTKHQGIYAVFFSYPDVSSPKGVILNKLVTFCIQLNEKQLGRWKLIVEKKFKSMFMIRNCVVKMPHICILRLTDIDMDTLLGFEKNGKWKQELRFPEVLIEAA